MPTIIEDAHIREQALDPTQSFIVQAPAGSGKTELLTQRYLMLLSHAQKAPEEIIAITFTRKAAAEMRMRIIHALQFGHEKEPEKSDYRHTTWQLAHAVLKKDAQQNWDLMQNPNRLRILTIDALSAFLCRQTPMLTHFGGSPAVCENAKSFYELAAQRVLADAQPTLAHLLLHLDNNVAHVEKLLADLLNHRDQWLPHILYCYKNSQALRESLENSLKRIVLEKMQMAATAMPEDLKQTLVMLARYAGNYFSENNPEHLLSSCENFTFELKPSLEKFSSWFGFANLFLTKEGQWRKTVDIRNGFAPKNPNKSLMLAVLTQLSEHESFKESLCDILVLPPTFYSESQWETLTSLTQLLPLLAAQLTLVFQEKGQIDFIELNLAALKALGNEESPTDLALYLDYQIRHLLIDEFQDTSVVHLHLLEKIIAGWEQDDGRTLFVVGDPMQSIYRFRNAEVGLFLRAQQQGIGSIYLEPLTLTMNFRSQANLTNWFNHTFQTVFPAVSDIATGRVPYSCAVAARPAIAENSAEFYPIISDHDADEAQCLVEKIIDLKKQNADDSIAILVRSRAQLIPIIHFLNQHQLSFQAVDIEPLANRLEIRDLLSLTRALLHRADRIAWLAILRAPFCGLTLADIEAVAIYAHKKTVWEAIQNAHSIVTLSEEGLRRLTKIKYYCELAFQTQYQQSLSQWIEQTWLNLDGPACLVNASELNYARAYFELIQTMENESSIISIEVLTENCERLFANADNTAENSIQIMTIHKSKGLEFDHVFLPGLQRQTPADQSKLLRWLDRPNALGGDDLILAPIESVTHQSDKIYDYLKLVENQKQDYEITRLLYVATTRAKKSLHLLATITEKKGELSAPKKGSFLEKLWPLYESIAVSHPIKITQAIIASEKSAPLFSRLINHSEFKTTETPIIKPVKIDMTLRSQAARVVGSVIHEILQTFSNARLSQKTQWHSRLLSLGVLPHETNDCLNIIEKTLSNIETDQRGQWVFSNAHQDIHTEWSLSYVSESEVEHVVIDRSFIDKDIRWIIDYKTSMPKEEESLAVFLVREKKTYEAQLNKYAEILAQMENRPVKLGLYFPLCCEFVEWDYTM